jgi:aqualysin 1
MAVATLLIAGVGLTQPPAERYIVVLEDDVDNPSQVASGIERRQDVEVGLVYSNALEGFSATIPDEDLAAVSANPSVAFIERDKEVHVAAQKTPWGVDRIDADISSTRAGNGRGKITNVNAYIIDTGIDPNHPDLNVVDRVNFTGDHKNHDCDGHGTHVAGTVAAMDNSIDVVGVAPGTPLTSVKVLDCQGQGTVSRVIKGVDWVTDNAKKPAVANMSLTTSTAEGPSRAFDEAVIDSAKSGVFYSVAAGNYHKDACNYSPARAGKGKNNGIVTTAATKESNEEASFSNFGSCVDLWAPGVNILSTWLKGGTRTLSGTSMSTPHIAGTGSLYLSNHTTAAPAAVEKRLKADSKPTGTKSEDRTPIRLDFAGGF